MPTIRQEQKAVLVIDDEAAARSDIAQMLAQLGILPITAANGQIGLELLGQETALGCVLLDLLLPDIQGAQIRTVAPHIPILAMSDQNTHSGAQLLSSIWIDGFLAKPFTLQELRACLEQVLDDQTE